MREQEEVAEKQHKTMHAKLDAMHALLVKFEEEGVGAEVDDSAPPSWLMEFVKHPAALNILNAVTDKGRLDKVLNKFTSWADKS